MAIKLFLSLLAVTAVSTFQATSTDEYAVGGRYYMDEPAAALYAVNTGDEIVMKQQLNATDGEAFDAWIQYIWLTGSGAQMITPGFGRGYVNYTRLVPSLSIKEQIISGGLPTDDDKLAIPTIEYKVREPGLFPILDHIAFVRFIQDFSQSASNQTEIVWTIKLTPSNEGNALFANGSYVAPFLKNAVVTALAGLATTVNELKQTA